MKEVGLYEAKTRFSALIKELEADGEPIALTRHGKVVAELRLPKKKKRVAGCMADPNFWMADDFDKDSLGFEEFFCQAGRRANEGRRTRTADVQDEKVSSCLVDTNVLLFFLTNSPRLSDAARELTSEASNVPLISLASFLGNRHQTRQGKA